MLIDRCYCNNNWCCDFFLVKKVIWLVIKKNISGRWHLKTNILFDFFWQNTGTCIFSFFSKHLDMNMNIFFSDNIWIEYDTRYHKWIDFRYELKKTCFIRLILFLKWHLAVANNFFSYSGLSCFTKDTNELLWSKNSILLIKKYQFIIRATKQGYYFFYKNLKKFVKYQYDSIFPYVVSWIFFFFLVIVFFSWELKRGLLETSQQDY